jgi:hypothetical protein
MPVILIFQWLFVILFLMKDVFIRNHVEEGITYQVVELRLVIWFRILCYNERVFPVTDFLERLAAVMSDNAVGNEKLTCYSLSSVWK